MLNLDFYFPTPVWWTDLDLDNTKLMDQIYDMRDNDPKGREISNRGGWQSQEINPDDIAELRDAIFPLVSQRCMSDYGYNPKDLALVFGNAWANINNEGDTNQIHLHHGSFLSGVYYVYAPEGSGKLFFYKNFDSQYIVESMAPIKNHTALSGGTVFYPATTGRLIIFPSNLPHAVDKNDEGCVSDRISIAFNLGLKKL